ncbi:LuxR C-terminal-related transcriptional regulator [Gordonia sp. (in: high G+C Gram-positive bacteria)]|uniref:LuxR C-terminal-related transcriptional regulator n=1 Tax=Gordonia sp. (in: high G+C Gram-positive bacteria) TaxID=84139 RepID=UPI0039E2406D
MSSAVPTDPAVIDEEDRAALGELRERADALLPDVELPADGPPRVLLRDVWTGVVAEINRIAQSPGGGPIGDLTDLLGQVRALEARLYDARYAQQGVRLFDVQRALSSLRGARSLDELHQLIAEQACTLGFDRAGVSSIDEGRWDFHTMFIEKNPALAREMVSAGQSHRPRLDNTLVENDTVARKRPVLVYDVQENPRVNQALTDISGCTSYAVAPIRVDGNVVGLIHADAFYAKRMVDSSDSAILDLYAEGVGHAMARVSLESKLAALRSSVDDLLEFNPRAATPIRPRYAEAAAPPEPVEALSPREVEVMELIASGATNRIIASRLCISEGTVKTHISHILRKIDVGNRAEAVSYWLRRQHAAE